MTTIKDYLLEMSTKAAEIGKQYKDKEWVEGLSEDESIKYLIDEYIDIIKERIVGE